MHENHADWTWVPALEWEWRVGDATQGVHTREGQLVWWERPSGPHGYAFEAARTQPFQDFVRCGAPVTAPPHVIEAIQRLLQGRG
jgi:hypothetical protein